MPYSWPLAFYDFGFLALNVLAMLASITFGVIGAAPKAPNQRYALKIMMFIVLVLQFVIDVMYFMRPFT